MSAENSSTIKLNLHIHSSASPDGIGGLAERIDRARKMGIDAIAVTDHNTIHPILRGKTLLNKKNVKIIVGEEINTDKGEIIGLFLKKPIDSGKAEDVLSEIKSQEAIAILPHPFKRSNIIYYPELIKEIDLIEVWNGRTSFEDNFKALVFASINKKYISCGSDAHIASEIGRSIIKLNVNDTILSYFNTPDTFLELIEKSQKHFEIVGTSKYCYLLESLSQFIKFVRVRDINALKNSLTFLIFEFLKNKNPTDIKAEILGENISVSQSD